MRSISPRRQAVLACVVGLASTFGCGPSGPETFSVSGTVTVNGKPVETGRINFENSAKGTGGSSELKSGGSYTAQLQKGDYRISVTPPVVLQDNGPETSQSEEYAKDSAINNKYWSAETSGLTLTVSNHIKDHKLNLE